MNRYIVASLTFAAVALIALPSFAIETRTYQFSAGGNRPFLYDSSWGLVVDAQLAGTFDLMLDQSAGTAQLTNLQARIINPANAPPKQNIPLTASDRAYFDNLLLSNRWPTNLSSLPGHFLAPDLAEFDGPSSGIFLVQPADSIRPTFGYRPDAHFVDGFNTVLQIKLGSSMAVVNGVAFYPFAIDAPFYYLLDAQATLVPEPNVIVPLAIGVI